MKLEPAARDGMKGKPWSHREKTQILELEFSEKLKIQESPKDQEVEHEFIWVKKKLTES